MLIKGKGVKKVFKVIGKRIRRFDGMGHVTGRTIYVDDIKLPGMFMIKVLRSPVPKAKILNLDVSPAKKTIGVAGVLTYKDVPYNRFGLVPDQPVLAEDEVRYKGQPIAAVAAVDEDTAMEAIDKIKLDLEEQTPVFDPIEAMKPDAPKVRPEGNLYMFDGYPCRKVRLGNVEEGFEKADYIIEGRYTNSTNEHAPLETQCSVAAVDSSDRLVIYTVSQDLYFHLGQLAPVLKMPLSKIRYIGGTVGGGFGAKNDIHADHITALMALKIKKPVKWRWTREEEMLYSTCRGAWIFEFKDGVTKDGRIIARKIKTIHDCGAYSALGPYVVEKNALLVSGPFAIPNIWIDGYCVYTNKTPASSMRGFGIINGSSAEQVQMEKIAKKLGMDSWEIRFKNAWREGDSTATRQKLKSVSLIETMQECAKLAGIELSEELKAMSSKERSDNN